MSHTKDEADCKESTFKKFKNKFIKKLETETEPQLESNCENLELCNYNQNVDDPDTLGCYHVDNKYVMGYSPNVNVYQNVAFNKSFLSQNANDMLPIKKISKSKQKNVAEFQTANKFVLDLSHQNQDCQYKIAPPKPARLLPFNTGKIDDQEEDVKSEFEVKRTKAQDICLHEKDKFGWIEGVLIRCLTSIFGVMLYLRISWVAGQAGLFLGSCIILLGALITTITAISMTAISTNVTTKSSGIYYLISRVLGREFGSSIGIIYLMANSVVASLYVVGFAETVVDVLRDYNLEIIDGGINDTRIIGLMFCLFVIGLITFDLNFESKIHFFSIVLVFVAIVNYTIGTLLEPTESQQVRGVTGYKIETLKENFFSSFQNGYDFFAVFAVYFPAATGIMAGVNINGDLKDPLRFIPLGTLLAILITTLIYLIFMWTTGSTVIRNADGISIPQLISWKNSSQILNVEVHNNLRSKTLLGEIILSANTQSLLNSSSLETLQYYRTPLCAFNSTCPHGLLNYFQIIKIQTIFEKFLTITIATIALCSTFTSLIGAAKVFQAVCRDKNFPYIHLFGNGHGRNEEPRTALFLASILALSMILIGDLNYIAPIVTNFFLFSYALLNYACFNSLFVLSPGFQTSFKYCNKWVSLTGSFICIFVMFSISWSTALLTFFFFAIVFFYLSHCKAETNSGGSSMQTQCFRNALYYLSKLDHIDDHVKNYRPQILVLSGNPASRVNLVDFAYSITKSTNLMLCSYVVPYNPCKAVFAMMHKLNNQIRVWFNSHQMCGFAVTIANKDLRAGVQTVIQTAGLGKLKPNVVLMGYKNIWNPFLNKNEVGSNKSLIEANNYVGMIHDIFLHGLSVGILRNGNAGFDITNCFLDSSSFAEEKSFSPVHSFKKLFKRVSSRNSVRLSPCTEKDNSIQSKRVNSFKNVNVENLQPASSKTKCASNYDATDNQKMNASLSSKSLPELISQEPLTQPSLFLDYDDEILTKGKTKNKFSIRKELPSKISMVRSSPPVNKKRKQVDISLVNTNCLDRFQQKIKNAVIDVWWLADDGGLTLLVPYLLSQPKSFLEGAKLRIFTVTTKDQKIEQEQYNLAALLGKFRIDCSHVNVVLDLKKKHPTEKSLLQFRNLIKPFLKEPTDYDGIGRITEDELKLNESKTWGHLRLAELLAKHSSNADLIVVTLPVPKVGTINSLLYMSWLEIISRNFPLMLMIRGNQQSVLTYYS